MQSQLPGATRIAVLGTVGSMATLEPVQGDTGEIAFELERYEFKGDDRVEISGRWSGVRGRRFIRPTLTVMTGGRGSRALADLEHKPWAPEEGKLWMAAFSCTVEDATALEAELNVAPDITITLSSFLISTPDIFSTPQCAACGNVLRPGGLHQPDSLRFAPRGIAAPPRPGTTN